MVVPFDKVFQKLLSPLRNRLDRTVIAVTDPPGKTKTFGFLLGIHAKTDALNPAQNVDLNSFFHLNRRGKAYPVRISGTRWLRSGFARVKDTGFGTFFTGNQVA